MINEKHEKVVDIATKENIDGRFAPADTDDVDLSGIEAPYRAAFSVAISRLCTYGRPSDLNVEVHDANPRQA